MHIYFSGKHTAENRIEALKHEMLMSGHSIGTFFTKPDTIHVHGWKAGLALRFVLPFLKNTSTVWTIATLPTISNSVLQWLFQKTLPQITKKFDSICTPNRTIQYHLLATSSVKSEYIPDGYTMPVLPDIRPATYGLRKEQYVVVLATHSDDIKQIAKIYKTLKTKKKLVLFSNKTYAGYKSINLPMMSRGAQSLVRQAACVISTDPSYNSLALQAMDSGRMIIATTDPLHEELFGTTAKYYVCDDLIQLKTLLQQGILKHPLNTAAKTRAKNHFSWEKIGQEYMRVYKHSKAVLVPFDSVFRVSADERTRTSTGFPTWS